MTNLSTNIGPTVLDEVFSFLKDACYDIVDVCVCCLINFSILSQSVPIFYVYLSLIYYFHHFTFHTCSSFLRGFPFSSFPLIFQISGRTYCSLIKQKVG